MSKKIFFLFKIPIKIYRYFKLKKIRKIRKKREENYPLEDYNYPLW